MTTRATRLDLAALAAVLREGVRPIPGHPHYYATAGGEVLSVHRTGDARILRASAHHRTGHLRVKLSPPADRRAAGERRRDHYVHRLVALAWHGPPPPELGGLDGDARVLHTDHDPTNNRPENLTWGTRAENTADRVYADRTRRLAPADVLEEGGALFDGDYWATHEAMQAVCGRAGVYLADPRWRF